MLSDYNNNLPNIKEVDLFIDACFISNKTDSELVSINPNNPNNDITYVNFLFKCLINK